MPKLDISDSYNQCPVDQCTVRGHLRKIRLNMLQKHLTILVISCKKCEYSCEGFRYVSLHEKNEHEAITTGKKAVLGDYFVFH